MLKATHPRPRTATRRDLVKSMFLGKNVGLRESEQIFDNLILDKIKMIRRQSSFYISLICLFL
jgi:hypothetical protein